jgi:phosphate transport system ATP-binding protein
VSPLIALQAVNEFGDSRAAAGQPREVERPGALSEHASKLQSTELSFYYGGVRALYDISLSVHANKITAFIGPSGCGKSTFLRALNRMYETMRNTRMSGEVLLDGENILDIEVSQLRRRVGMVFQKSNPFPKSIFDNVAYGLRVNGMRRKPDLEQAVVRSLQRSALWNEVRDKLHKSAYDLSGGQQQRLCIARALAVEPEVLLLDEPCSALDPIATAKIEELLFQIKDLCTVVIVTHNMQQAARVADYTGFFLMGKLIEFDTTKIIFERPSVQATEDYITGRFG